MITTGAELVTVAELASRLRVCTATVRKLYREGSIPSVRIGRSVRFDPNAVDASLRGAARCQDARD